MYVRKQQYELTKTLHDEAESAENWRRERSKWGGGEWPTAIRGLPRPPSLIIYIGGVYASSESNIGRIFCCWDGNG